jgi:hypothetical protein
MQNTSSCGKAKVTYSDTCSWTCYCQAGRTCQWAVDCPDGHGGTTTTSGTGIVVVTSWPWTVVQAIYGAIQAMFGKSVTGRQGHFSYDGTAEGIAAQLEKLTGKRVTVPEGEHSVRITGEVDGDAMAAARKLGFTVMDMPASTE